MSQSTDEWAHNEIDCERRNSGQQVQRNAQRQERCWSGSTDCLRAGAGTNDEGLTQSRRPQGASPPGLPWVATRCDAPETSANVNGNSLVRLYPAR